MDTVVRRRRKKLDPDPGLRDVLINAAAEIVRDEGIAAISVARVLSRAELSTRAFYRHFDSKDALVSAVFLQMARAEMRRLKRRMAAASNPAERWWPGSTDAWTWRSTPRSDLTCGRCRWRRRRRCSRRPTGQRRLRGDLEAARRTARKGKGRRAFSRHRPGGRCVVDTRCDLGECRTPMGDRRL